LVSNNLSFKCGVTGVQGCGVYLGARGNSSENYIAKNNTMQNNIAIDSRQAFCKNAYADDTNRWYNNISYRNGSGQYPSGIHSNLINADPKLVNYKADGTGDYHLAAGSPAIDSGRATGAPAADYDGAIGPIGSAFDRGAYEYGSGNVGGIR
jgi:hypothetical protein